MRFSPGDFILIAVQELGPTVLDFTEYGLQVWVMFVFVSSWERMNE